MKVIAFLFALLLAFCVKVNAQPKPLSNSKLVRLTISSQPEKPLQFLGVEIESITAEGTEKNIIDFFKNYLFTPLCSCTLLSDAQCLQRLIELHMIESLPQSKTSTYYLVAANLKKPDDFSHILQAPKSHSTGRPKKSNCEEDICLKVCETKVCVSYECDDYSVEVCYNGQFSATISNGIFNITFPQK